MSKPLMFGWELAQVNCLPVHYEVYKCLAYLQHTTYKLDYVSQSFSVIGALEMDSLSVWHAPM